MSDYLKQLNPQQYEAATTVDGPLLILAGAGSGKTGTMTHRIAYMIREKGISPYSILAVTFTNKAAGEMRERVEALVGDTKGLWILTFHSACLRILRKHADLLGYSPSFTVYDPVDQKSLVRGIVKELELDEKRYSPVYCLGVISDCKEKRISPEDFAKRSGSYGSSSDVAKVYDKYEIALKKNNAMDFDDLLLNAVRLFETYPDVLAQYQARFQYIMVDEYQDTNMLQYDFVKLLSKKHHNLCVVGDDDQCIYEWRGADIRNILSFEKDFPGAKVIKLEQNYRSKGNIINAAHSVIQNNHDRKDKKLWTEDEDGEKIEYYRADDDLEEARYVAAKIKKLMRENPEYKFSDFAILYRNNVQSRRFEDCLGGINMPYQILSGFRFYERAEIKDMMSYMRLIDNPKDDVSFRRIINVPRRGFGDKTLNNLDLFAQKNGWSLFEALESDAIQDELSAKCRNEAVSFVNMINGFNVEKDNTSVGEIYDALLVKTGYLKLLQEQNSVESDAKVENLLEFKTVIAEQEKKAKEDGEELSLGAFMEGMALMSDVDNHDPDADCVTMMTLHSAKGLEFKVVFMPGMETGLFPSYRSSDSPARLEEERRLCYVGITRAKERLFMSSAERRMLYGKTDYTTESKFLKEIDKKYLTGHPLYEKKQPGTADYRYDTDAPYRAEGPYVSPIALAAKMQRAADIAHRETLSGTDIVPGDRVLHTKFGEGTVISVDKNILTVVFNTAGTKKMAKDLAPLKKL